MIKKLFAIVVTSMLLLAGCGGQTPKSEGTGNATIAPQQVEQASAPSGKLVLYTSQPDSDAAALIAAYNKKYPDVQVELFRSGTEEVISKIQAEKQAGEVKADVLLVADAVTFEGLKAQEMLMSYKSPEAAKIPENFVDPDGMYSGTKVIATVIGFHNSVGNGPDSWKALTDSSTKGQLVMASPLYSGTAAYNLGVLSRLGNFGWDFFKGLKANEATVVKGNGAAVKMVSSGEKKYGMIVDFMIAQAKAKGSPIDLIYPKEGVPVITEPIGIIKDAKNLEAAKSFVDFALSEEGQKVAVQIGYTPIREGIPAPAGLKTYNQINVLEGDVKELYKAREGDKKEFAKLFE